MQLAEVRVLHAMPLARDDTDDADAEGRLPMEPSSPTPPDGARARSPADRRPRLKRKGTGRLPPPKPDQAPKPTPSLTVSTAGVSLWLCIAWLFRYSLFELAGRPCCRMDWMDLSLKAGETVPLLDETLGLGLREPEDRWRRGPAHVLPNLWNPVHGEIDELI